MGNQHPSPEQGKDQRLIRKDVGTSVPKWWVSAKADKDIVCSSVKTEGLGNQSGLISEQTLTLGTISDEAYDMGGEEFLYYIYDEITYRIAKKAQELLLAKITALTASATSTAVSVGIVDDGAPSLSIVSECLGTLSDEATDPVIVMNKATWSQFKSAQYSAQYAVDPFEGLPVYFDSTIPAYSSTATTGVWLVVGDFGRGAQANFPNGQEINLKFDDLSLAESDLIKIVGREYVGLGVVGDRCFCKVTMHT